MSLVTLKNGRGHHRAPASMAGVTLIELMIVVLIIGILSAIAIPSYRQYILRVNRTDAKRELAAVAQRLERCFTRMNSYAAGVCTATFPVVTENGSYTVTGDVQQTTFLLTATPIGRQADDTKCGNFTLTNAGVRDRTGTAALSECW